MGRARVFLGTLSGGMAGAVLGYSYATRGQSLLWLGGVALLPSLLLLLAPSRPSAALPEADFTSTPVTPNPAGGSPIHQLLGRLMVDRYRMITQAQLEDALARQKGTTRLLGEVLIEMGLITIADLRRVLEDQRLGADLWHPMDRAEVPDLRPSLGGTVE